LVCQHALPHRPLLIIISKHTKEQMIVIPVVGDEDSMVMETRQMCQNMTKNANDPLEEFGHIKDRHQEDPCPQSYWEL
jgi:hypothetical protein